MNLPQFDARALMDAIDVAKLEARNLEKYQHPVGPSVDWLVQKAKSTNPGISDSQALQMVIDGSQDTSFLYNLFFFAF